MPLLASFMASAICSSTSSHDSFFKVFHVSYTLSTAWEFKWQDGSDYRAWRPLLLRNWAGPFICVCIKIRHMWRAKFLTPPALRRA